MYFLRIVEVAPEKTLALEKNLFEYSSMLDKTKSLGKDKKDIYIDSALYG